MVRCLSQFSMACRQQVSMPWVLSLAPGMLLDQTFEIAATVDLQAQLTPRKALVIWGTHSLDHRLANFW